MSLSNLSNMTGKKGVIEGETITDILLWIVFLVVAGTAVYIAVKRWGS